MASAIWPPPMNVILLVIVGLGMPRSPKSPVDSHHRGPLFDCNVIIVRHTLESSFKEGYSAKENNMPLDQAPRSTSIFGSAPWRWSLPP